MNSIRTSLGLLYLLLVALLPWLHMPMHAVEAEAQACTAGCGHHEAPADVPDDHDDCGLCNLTHIPAELPGILIAPEAIYIFSETRTYHFISRDTPLSQTHQARAPPFQTV